jgi:hypothetical protein
LHPEIENMENTMDHIPQSGIEIYVAPDNSIQLQVKLDQDTVWLSVEQMAMLFGKEESNIRRHIINIFRDEEVPRENNVHFLHVNGVKKPVPFYSLDMILSIGYRVNSKSAIAFRQWANRVLKEYLLKGYAVRKDMQLKQYEELKQLVGVLQHTMQTEALTTNEANKKN